MVSAWTPRALVSKSTVTIWKKSNSGNSLQTTAQLWRSLPLSMWIWTRLERWSLGNLVVWDSLKLASLVWAMHESRKFLENCGPHGKNQCRTCIPPAPSGRSEDAQWRSPSSTLDPTSGSSLPCAELPSTSVTHKWLLVTSLKGSEVHALRASPCFFTVCRGWLSVHSLHSLFSFIVFNLP